MYTYNSNCLIDVQLFKEFCNQTQIKLLSDLNIGEQRWIYLSPTAHGVLNHTSELFEANGSKGILAFQNLHLRDLSNSKVEFCIHSTFLEYRRHSF